MSHHHKEIAELIDTTFRADEARLREEHKIDLRESQARARHTRNAAALLPAEAESYIRHIRTLTVARAQAMADAYTGFNQPCGEECEKDLETYYDAVLSARRSAFQAQSELSGRRSGRSLSQLPGLLRRFETDSHAALLEGRSILAKQRVRFRNPSSAPSGAASSALNDDDRRFAQMAIEEAAKSVPEDNRPHPRVGAVVVKDGRVLTKAHRGESPKSHAEYIALEQRLRDDIIAGATVYTTLEPCTTRKHPKIPCAQRLVERRVASVVIGMLDPNPEILGRGMQALREACIEIQFFPGPLQAQVEEMNREFIRAQKGNKDRHYRYAQPTSESPRTYEICERQVESLLLIHSKLEEALFCLQRASAAGKLAGEASDEELLRRMVENLGAASKKFGKSRLLFSESLGKKLDEFFNKMLSGSMTLTLALSPTVQDGYQRAKLWDEARDKAYRVIPPLLKIIREESRGIIHG